MARYGIGDLVVDTDNATECWEETTDWDGRNHISRATGSQWQHQTLYRSRRGRYYIVHTSQWQGSRPYAEFIDDYTAARWLMLMETRLPAEVAKFTDEVSE